MKGLSLVYTNYQKVIGELIYWSALGHHQVRIIEFCELGKWPSFLGFSGTSLDIHTVRCTAIRASASQWEDMVRFPRRIRLKDLKVGSHRFPAWRSTLKK